MRKVYKRALSNPEVKKNFDTLKNILNNTNEINTTNIKQNEINNYINDHSVILSRTANTVSVNDERRLNAAINAYNNLSNEVKAELKYQKSLLDKLANKISSLKKDSEIQTKVNNFKQVYLIILAKNEWNITINDESRITLALKAYNLLSYEIKAKLTSEKILLDKLAAKIRSLKQEQTTNQNTNDPGNESDQRTLPTDDANAGIQTQQQEPDQDSRTTFGKKEESLSTAATYDNQSIKIDYDNFDVQTHRLDYNSLQNSSSKWSSYNINNELSNNAYKELVSGFYGINISRHRKTDQVDKKNQKAIVVEIDVSQTKAYQNAKAFIDKISLDTRYKITGYRIKNIGKNKTLNMDDIFSEIPNKLPLLELFFANKNTTVLRRLKDKEIKELNFYTDSKQEAESNEWAINPLVLSNIKNINLAKNPATSNYNQTSYYVIKFDNLSFDEEDVYIAGEFDLYKINKALKMFYWTRNNEKFFQGLGLTYQLTDRDEKIKITWPLGLDFSNAPSIKSLAGLDFRNRDSNYNYNNTYRKLLRIKFYNNSDMWTLNTNELNKNQVREVILGNTLSESAKITF
ncbi:hypothetical protein CO229_02015 [Mycoplasmopsis bovirhinis]|uniref:putative immunoglobulin-blocking virulence protein n=1 Tax=Mycoplasmopsis bovirhinis TaxID=29553 RepID=UPI000C05C6E9|nr:putative immunoglobulin-blocking virulence protein [Mycoplasmopsis bovirhinis]ATO30880.1 hypothetical protein CO229_02015 [Mycoplasmopsis bovirhinis]